MTTFSCSNYSFLDMLTPNRRASSGIIVQLPLSLWHLLANLLKNVASQRPLVSVLTFLLLVALHDVHGDMEIA